MRWALIGASDIAETAMIPALRACGENPVIVVSGDRGRARDYASRNQVLEGTDDLQAALESGVDAVYISSRNEKHFDQAIAAMRAGLHVLCEKPLAMTLTEATTMADTAAEAGVVLATNHHLRNNRVLATMRDLLAAGEIGDQLAVRVAHAVLLPERLRGWRLAGSEVGAGIPLDITVHDIDTIRYVTGLEPTVVTAISARQGLGEGVDDAVMVNGLLGETVLFSTFDAFTVPHATTSFEVHGTEGSLIGLDCMTPRPAGTLELLRDGHRTAVPIDNVDNLYEPSVTAFVEAVRGTGCPIATGQDGLRSVNVALAVMESVATGRTATVSAPTVTSSSPG